MNRFVERRLGLSATAGSVDDAFHTQYIFLNVERSTFKLLSALFISSRREIPIKLRFHDINRVCFRESHTG
jgi:hypothetical protein